MKLFKGMNKFQFRLETVLTLRKRKEEQAKGLLLSPEQMVSTSSDKKIGLDELQAHILGIIEVLNATLRQS